MPDEQPSYPGPIFYPDLCSMTSAFANLARNRQRLLTAVCIPSPMGLELTIQGVSCQGLSDLDHSTKRAVRSTGHTCVVARPTIGALAARVHVHNRRGLDLNLPGREIYQLGARRERQGSTCTLLERLTGRRVPSPFGRSGGSVDHSVNRSNSRTGPNRSFNFRAIRASGLYG